jgi:glucokinase
MNPPAPPNYIIGLDLGGSSIKSVAVTPAGQILTRATHDFDPTIPMIWAQQIKTILTQIRSHQTHPETAIGLAAPGLAACDARSIAHMPGRLEGLEGLIWKDYLNTDFEIPILNDAHAALLGETWLGAAKGCRNVIMLTLGTGVGGAAIVDGRLLLGHIGRAGHLGHATVDMHGPPDITNLPGALEIMIGNCSIQERTKGRYQTTHALITAHQQGDPFATDIWHQSIRALAFALAGYINILDPEKIIIGGGIARAGATLFDPLENFLRPIEWQPGAHHVPIHPAQLGEYAGALGAAFRTLPS